MHRPREQPGLARLVGPILRDGLRAARRASTPEDLMAALDTMQRSLGTLLKAPGEGRGAKGSTDQRRT